jgi:SAM-dependent methyltransferase
MRSRETGLGRLSGFDVYPTNPYFLHYRTLFADLQRAARRAHGRLLDIGCGNKPYEKMFADRITEHVGCDVVQSSGNRVDYLCLATELPFPEASFDTVLITQVIEHVADHRAMLAEAFRVLKPNGVLIVSGPMYWPLHEEPYDFFRFTEHGFRWLLETAGFSGIEIKNNGGKWALCGQVLIHTIYNTWLHHGIVVQAINRLFAAFDDRSRDRDNPMNYVVVAIKPASQPAPANRP